MSISKKGLAFVDITYEISFQERSGIPKKDFGLIYAMKSKPLPFEYEASDAVSSFVVKQVNNIGEVIESTSLSTSLITSDGSSHLCDGLTDYAADLDCGLYYFLVNSKYQSEYFRVDTQLIDGTLTNTDISVNGLKFYDNNYTVPWRERIGSPDIFFGMEYAENSTPLYFDYISSDAVSSFKAIRVDNLGNDVYEYDLTTSLISVSDHHICNGLTDYSQALQCGVYYYSVNGQYESELFQVLELENDVWILETGIWDGDGIWTATGIWNTI